ncbi:MAG: hypothetical protein U5M23_16450 [Marinagarivorans sp.]|nr:hypothetical protein [Marinagarivorans sp.]
MIIKGYYLDGQTSKRVAARLEVVENASLYLFLQLDDALQVLRHKKIRLEFSDITLESRLGNTPREINITGNALFVTEDNDGVDALLNYFKQQRKTVTDSANEPLSV